MQDMKESSTNFQTNLVFLTGLAIVLYEVSRHLWNIVKEKCDTRIIDDWCISYFQCQHFNVYSDKTIHHAWRPAHHTAQQGKGQSSTTRRSSPAPHPAMDLLPFKMEIRLNRLAGAVSRVSIQFEWWRKHVSYACKMHAWVEDRTARAKCAPSETRGQ